MKNTLQSPAQNDDADYYYAYSFDKANWNICKSGKIVVKFTGIFTQVVDRLEELDRTIKPKMIHN